MDRSIARENVRRFREHLWSETDQDARARLRKLLVAEEDKLAADLELLADIRRHISDGDRRIDRQRALVNAMERDSRNGLAQAKVLLDCMMDTQVLHKKYCRHVQSMIEQNNVPPLIPATSSLGPAIHAIDPWHAGNPQPGEMKQLLSEEQRTRLAGIASIVRFAKGAVIYRADDTAKAAFNIVSGVVKKFKTASDGSDYIAAFLFPGDVFGLSAEGCYIHSTKAITPVIAYQLPVSAFRDRLLEGAGLEFHVIRKLYHELRQTQRHAFLLAQRSALSRLAMFLQMLEQLQAARGEVVAEIYLPMSRSDIGKYIRISIAAVSRGFQTLTQLGVIRCRDLRHVEIIDRSAFEKLAADPYGFQTTANGSQATTERRHA